jgi:hypothetical protein
MRLHAVLLIALSACDLSDGRDVDYAEGYGEDVSPILEPCDVVFLQTPGTGWHLAAGQQIAVAGVAVCPAPEYRYRVRSKFLDESVTSYFPWPFAWRPEPGDWCVRVEARSIDSSADFESVSPYACGTVDPPVSVDVPAASFVRSQSQLIAPVAFVGEALVPSVEAFITCSTTTDVVLCALQQGFTPGAEILSICGLPVTRCAPGAIYGLKTETSFGISLDHGVKLELIAPTAPDLTAVTVVRATAFLAPR